MRPATGRDGGDRGQATVELALAIPLVVVLALAVVQVGWLVHDLVLVTHAAREAARAAAVSNGSVGEPPWTGLEGGRDRSRLQVTIDGPDDSGVVTATVSYRSPTDVALVGPLLPDVDITRQVSMLAEPVR